MSKIDLLNMPWLRLLGVCIYIYIYTTQCFDAPHFFGVICQIISFSCQRSLKATGRNLRSWLWLIWPLDFKRFFHLMFLNHHYYYFYYYYYYYYFYYYFSLFLDIFDAAGTTILQRRRQNPSPVAASCSAFQRSSSAHHITAGNWRK